MPLQPNNNLPSFADGVSYWSNTEASVDGVLGGFGEKTAVPRLDATSSRLLILDLLPELSTIVPPHHHSSVVGNDNGKEKEKRIWRALDAGAGIGRITSTVLLPLGFNRIDLVEPVDKFLKVAAEAGKRCTHDGWKLLKEKGKEEEEEGVGVGVRMWEAGLQIFDPLSPGIPLNQGASRLHTTLASTSFITFPDPSISLNLMTEGYDIILIQWCIGHLSDPQLIELLQRSTRALRRSETGQVKGFVILKENTCKDSEPDGKVFDTDDSSITRSDGCFKRIFLKAGLTLLREETQKGFPKELFPVISYVLR